MVNRSFVMMTLSQNLNKHYPATIRKVSLFNFQDGRMTLNLEAKNKSKFIVGTIANCWIRVYDIDDLYYDFISSSVFFDYNATGLVLLCSEDTEFISKDVIASTINEFVDNNKDFSFANNNEKTLRHYIIKIDKEVRVASKKLLNLYSISSNEKATRGLLDVEDEYEYGRAKLIKKYLKNLILLKIFRENKEEILMLI